MAAGAEENTSTDAAPTHADNVRLTASLLAGFDRNEYASPDPHTGQMQVHKDTKGEYGAMLTYISPYVTANDILFYANPNDSRVWGNIFAGSVCGDPEANITWTLGVSYTWHEIEMPGIALRINEPLVRVGPLFRIPSCHLTWNPYVGYAHLAVATTYGSDAWDTRIYGGIVRWDWRMLHAFGQYYLQDNPAQNQVYHVARVSLATFVTKNWGIILRGEYMRQYSSKDTSLMLGPVYLF